MKHGIEGEAIKDRFDCKAELEVASTILAGARSDQRLAGVAS